MVAELYAAIPDNTVVSNSIHTLLSELEFSCDHIIQFTRHNAVGCGEMLFFNSHSNCPMKYWGSSPIFRIYVDSAVVMDSVYFVSGVLVILSEDGESTIPLIFGTLFASVSWGVNEQGNSLAPSSNEISSKRYWSIDLFTIHLINGIYLL